MAKVVECKPDKIRLKKKIHMLPFNIRDKGDFRINS